MPICELIVTNILPAVRSVMAKNLLEKGFTQGEIAKMMGLSQPSVSHYLKGIRAKNTESFFEDKQIKELIDSTLGHVMTHNPNPQEIDAAICNICRDLKHKGLMCQFDRNAPASCDVCLTKGRAHSGYS